MNNTRTTLGRNLLREWLLRPSLSLPVIAARHATVACFVNPDNIATAGDIQKHLSGVKHTPRILKMLKSGGAKVKDWQGVVEVRVHSCRALHPLSHTAMIPFNPVCISRCHDPRLAGGVGSRQPCRNSEEGRDLLLHRKAILTTSKS